MTHAAKGKLYKSGQRSAAEILGSVTTTPTRAIKIKKQLNQKNSGITRQTSDEALAFFMDNKLTKDQYINIRVDAKKRNSGIYPPYSSVVEAKTRCYPQNYRVLDTGCYIPIQDLLNHTVQRICKIPGVQINFINHFNFNVIYKWGCDGTSDQSHYKQLFNANEKSTSDARFVKLYLKINFYFFVL